MSNQALSGVRVLDFTRVLAGPLCTMLLGDLGADVIKVEFPGSGDDTRRWGPPWAGTGAVAQSAYFLSINRNKRSMTLNLKARQGCEIARSLAGQSHIVIENFKRGQMAAFGLDYDHLRAINPQLVYCSITGFGQTGPYADYPGYDYVIQAMSGLMSITGPVDGMPYKVGVAISDVVTGLFAVSSILAALRHSEKTGVGQYIDLALLDSQIAALVNVAGNYLVSGETPPRFGNEHPNIVPYQVFSALDTDFVIAVGNDSQFAQLCRTLERPDLIEDPLYRSNALRVENRQQLEMILQTIFSGRIASEWIDLLRTAGIPASPINDIATILNDPHVEARGLVHDVVLPNGEMTRLVGPPAQFSETPPTVRLPPPHLGQHTDEILKELLGVDESTAAAYRAAGII